MSRSDSPEAARSERERPVSASHAGADRSATSCLGFGCAGLMQVPSRGHRQRLLADAFEQGIRHFDVARMYGLGAAERELGRFARGRREQIVVATKFGIEPAAVSGGLGRLQAPARAVIARSPALRAAVKRRSDAFHRPHRYDLATLNASLETSLRELGSEYVDILFVHGPQSDDIADIAELSDALERLRGAGRVRAWGFAGDPEPCIALSGRVSLPTVLQIRDDIFNGALSRVEQSERVITFGLLSGALKRILDHVTASVERRSRWQAAICADCGYPEAVASLLLQDALDRNRTGTVVFSTTRPERITIATGAVETLACERDPAPLRAFRRLVSSELSTLVAVGG